MQNFKYCIWCLPEEGHGWNIIPKGFYPHMSIKTDMELDEAFILFEDMLKYPITVYLKDELVKSLRRLGLENIDLFYVHRRDPTYQIEEVTETLLSFVNEGLIKHFGFSEIAPSSLRRAQKIGHVGAVQSEYSLSVRGPELGLLQSTIKNSTTFVAFSPEYLADLTPG